LETARSICSFHASARLSAKTGGEQGDVHPAKPNPLIGVGLLEWYHPAVDFRQQE